MISLFFTIQMLNFLYSPLSTRLWLLADFITIIWFIIGLFVTNKIITNKIITLESNINIWNNSDDVIKYLNWLSEHDKEKYDKIMKTLVEHDEMLSKAQYIDIVKDWDDYAMVIEDIKKHK